MTDEEKIGRLAALGWRMYHAAQNMSTDARPLRQAMKDWYNFINFEMNKN